VPEFDYVTLISNLDRNGLLDLWAQIEKGDTADWPAGIAFEYLVLRALELDGAEVRWPFSVKLEGELVEQIDGVIYADGLSRLIESKHRSSKLNVEAIAKLRNQLARRPATAVGVVFSYSGFTDTARKLAQYLAPQTILLWHGSEIKHALMTEKMVSGLRLKYEHAVEHGLPDYNLLKGAAL